MAILGALMISEIPIYSAKKINISKERVSIILIVIGMIFTGIILEPWIILPTIGVCYILFIPFRFYLSHRTKKVLDDPEI
jgi:CDP-diacylglycerol--serine O-phosphatidyltransferase